MVGRQEHQGGQELHHTDGCPQGDDRTRQRPVGFEEGTPDVQHAVEDSGVARDGVRWVAAARRDTLAALEEAGEWPGLFR